MKHSIFAALAIVLLSTPATAQVFGGDGIFGGPEGQTTAALDAAYARIDATNDPFTDSIAVTRNYAGETRVDVNNSNAGGSSVIAVTNGSTGTALEYIGASTSVHSLTHVTRLTAFDSAGSMLYAVRNATGSHRFYVGTSEGDATEAFRITAAALILNPTHSSVSDVNRTVSIQGTTAGSPKTVFSADTVNNCVGIGANCATPTVLAAEFSNAKPIALYGGTILEKALQQTISTLTYASSTPIDFNANSLQSVTLTGNITFTTSNLAAGRSASVRIVGDGSIRTLTFPGTWTFIGGGAPANLAASKTAILSLVSWSTTDASVVAAYAVQP